MDITWRYIGIVGRVVVHNLRGLASKAVTSLVGRTEPSNFHLFERIKQHLAGKRYTTDAVAKQAVASWLQTFDAGGIVRKRLNVDGHYVDVWCVLSSTHVRCVAIKFSESECLLLHLWKHLVEYIRMGLFSVNIVRYQDGLVCDHSRAWWKE